MTEKSPSHERPRIPAGLELPLQHYSLLLRQSNLYKVGTRCLLSTTAALIAAIILDAYWVSLQTKWWASLLFYGAVFGSLIALFFPVVFPRRRNLTNLAQMVEARSRRTRNLLVAAIELGQNPSPGCSDAMVSAVQADAQDALESLDIRQLISPTPRLKFRRQVWLTLVVLLSSLVVPGVHMPIRFARVFFPMLDVGRVSWIAISVPQPRPTLIARGDLVRIDADISGPWQGEATLEIRSVDKQRPTRQMMYRDRESVRRAVRQVSIDYPKAQYRVVSQNAWTRWYSVETLVRPQVAELRVTSYPPESAHSRNNASAIPLPSQSVALTNDRPALQVVRGSSVQIDVTTNSPVEIAQIHISNESTAHPASPQQPASQDAPLVTNGKTNEYPLQSVNLGEGLEWRYRFTADVPQDFRIHLVGGPKALTNRYAPTFRIEVVDDLAPSLTWIQPTVTGQLVTPRQVLELDVKVTDEGPLDDIWLSCEIQRGESQRFRLKTVPLPGVSNVLRRDYSIRYSLDLSELEVGFGDRLDLVVSALDQLGQRAETTPLQLHVVQQLGKSPGSRSLVELFDLATKLDGYAKRFSDIASSQSPPAMQREEIDGLRRDSRQLIASIFAQAKRARGRSVFIEEAIQASADLLAEQSITLAAEFARISGASSSPFVPPAHVLEIQSQKAASTAEAFRRLVELDLTREIADSASILHEQLLELQELLKKFKSSPQGVRDPRTRNQVVDSTTIVTISAQHHVLVIQADRFARQLVDIIDLLGESNSGWLEAHYRQLRFLVDRQRSASAELNSRLLDHQLAQLVTSFEVLSDAVRLMLERNRKLKNALADLAANSVSFSVSSAEILDHAASEISSPQGFAKSDDVLYSAASAYAAQRSLRRLLRPGNAKLTGDLGLAHRATLEQVESVSLTRVSKMRNFRSIAGAMNTLHAAASLKTSFDSLQYLAPEELAGRALTSSARVLTANYHMVRSRTLANIEHQSTNTAFGEASENFDQFAELFIGDTSPIALLSARESLLAELAATIDEFEPFVTDARDTLRSLGPSLQTLASRAADKANQLQLMTNDLATEVQRGGVDKMRNEVAALSAELPRRTSPTRQLHDALVDLAETQDLLDSSQLSLARSADKLSRPVAEALQQQLRSFDSIDSTAREEELVQQLRQGASQQESASHRLAQIEQQIARQLEQVLPQQRRSPIGEQRENNDSAAEKPTPSSQETSQSESQSGRKQANDRSTTSRISGNTNSAPPTSNPATSQASPEPMDASTRQTEDSYRNAEQLAEFVQLSPDEMLSRLEAYLPYSTPMQDELSAITQAAYTEAHANLSLSSSRQQSYLDLAQQSNPTIQTTGDIRERVIRNTIKEIREVSMYLLREYTKFNASALRSSQREADNELLAVWAQELQHLEEATTKSSENRPRTSTQFDAITQLKSLTAQMVEFHKVAETRLLRESKVRSSRETEDTTGPQNQSAQDMYRRLQQTVLRSRRELLRELQLDDQHVRSRISRLSVSEQKLNNLLRRTARQSKQEWLEATKVRLADEQERVSEFLKQRIAETRKSILALSPGSSDLKDDDANSLRVRMLELISESLLQSSNQIDSNLKVNTASLPLARWVAFDTEHIVAAHAAAQTASQCVLRAGRHDRRLATSDVQDGGIRLQRGDAAAKTGEAVRQIAERHIQPLLKGLQKIQDLSPVQANTPEALVDLELGLPVEEELLMALKRTSETKADLQKFGTRFSRISRSEIAQRDKRLDLSADDAGAGRNVPPSSGETAFRPGESIMKPPVPLPPRELALLVDQLDRILHDDRHLGEADNDSAAERRSGTTPAQISRAAQQIAEQLSVSRTQAAQSAPSDRGQATNSEASMSESDPTSIEPVDVVFDELSIDGDWANLREQNDERAGQQATPSVPIEYREIVEGYFRRLGDAER
ncbi:MAG TPA: hypothetical protein DDW52_21775 [Planctomycetaceae bacterium]|nr:hypothetical protein [Planctomycetaceae bacterium]